MKIVSPPGATPLDDDVLNALIPGLTLQSELDEFEAANITRAVLWGETSRRLKQDLLSVSGLKLLHKKMFEETWTWAGEFRQRQTNIGVSPQVIQNDLAILLGDVQYWLKNKTFSLDEIAVRFHHRLVWIHPFVNGNGRFARLATDFFLNHQGQQRFTWGQGSLSQIGEVRAEYIRCLQSADRKDEYGPLLKFVRS